MNAAQDLRFAVRQLGKTPGLTLTVILTLALGIGATTAIFSLVEGVLLRPLPFRDPDRLVALGDHLRSGRNTSVTAREIGTYSNATSAFSSLGGYIGGGYELSGGTVPEEIFGARLTAGVFPTLGVTPILGRIFTPEEEDRHQPLAVISYALWLNHYARDSHILGNSIVLDRKTYTIVGVMPRNFEFPLQPGHINQAQVWIPMMLTQEEILDQAGFWGYQMVARLKDGVTLSQAAQDANRVAGQIMRDFPVTMSAIHIRGDVTPLREYAVAGVRPLLRTLFFAVSVVLLIACINVAALLLVQAIRQHREHAVRLALGAPASAILRASLWQSLLLSLMGGLLGLACAAIAIRAALHILPESMPRIDSIAMDAPVSIFALIVALLTGALCSLAPGFAALRTNVTETLKEGDRTGTGTLSHGRLRSALVVSEIAIALVLLTSSGALLRSFENMRAVDPGFRPDHVLVAGYQLPLQQYSSAISADTFDRAVVDRLSSKPGITAVGLTDNIPASDQSPQAAYTIEDEPVDRWKLKFAAFALTYGDYFRAMQIRLIDGRYFTIDDRSDSPLVIIVNQTMAKHCWPGQRPIGKRMHVGNPKKGLPWATVVGVVADTKIGSRDQPSTDQWYAPMQQPDILGLAPGGKLADTTGGYVALRSVLAPEQMTQTLRSAIAEIDPLLPLENVQPMDDVISNVEAPRRFNTDLITVFAAGALLLATTGIYGVLAFSVSMRRREIAVRMALGAQPGNIARLILRSGVKFALLGCGLGVLGSLAISRLLRSFLFAVSATDPLTYLTSVLIMMSMVFLASMLPATRAASEDPLDVLRST
jgi:predicted permease